MSAVVSLLDAQRLATTEQITSRTKPFTAGVTGLDVKQRQCSNGGLSCQ